MLLNRSAGQIPEEWSQKHRFAALKKYKLKLIGKFNMLLSCCSGRSAQRAELTLAIRRSFEESRRTYGYRKVRCELAKEGMSAAGQTVRTIMRKEGLMPKTARRFVVTTKSGHGRPVADNLMDRDFAAAQPNRKWAADMTYIRTGEGWLYLAAVMDLYSRMIVGWSFSERMDTELTRGALLMAAKRRGTEAGLVHHSDRGVQYASEKYRKELSNRGMICSMSRAGDCYDNACMESFFGKLKSERVCGRAYAAREEAKRDLFWYIEVFYNRIRRHTALGYVSLAQFEAEAAK